MSIPPAKGEPSKSFFIDMITRDLGLTDCILDLIDNAVDIAVARSAADVMGLLTNGKHRALFRDATISLRISAHEFLIEDTCGGISIADATERVFRFGTPGTREGAPGLSVYGIGMKRAFFKLGERIEVQSATAREWFRIDIDVPTWQSQDAWDFPFTDQGPSSQGDLGKRPGTRIRIRRLREGIGRRLSQASFQNQLVSKIAATYALFLAAGLRIRVGDEDVKSALPTLGSYRDLDTARKVISQQGVQILIIAGVTPYEDRTPRGWYVFCNGRMLLEADRSSLTGWGETVPQWHTKFGHFVGYVYFKSEDVRLLPWTTTKQGVVFESPVYQGALAEMQVQSRPVLRFLTDMYPGEQTPEGVQEREVLKKAQSLAIDKIPRAETAFAVRATRDKKSDEARSVRIQYSKTLKEIDRVRRCLNKPRMSASAVGEHTFDYFVKQECE